MPPGELDLDAPIGASDLAQRTGGGVLTVGYRWDETDPEYADNGAQWWAMALYPDGNRVAVEGHDDPDEACDALARRILAGAVCQHCGRTAQTGDPREDLCIWTRTGQRWIRGCLDTHPEGQRLNRTGRRHGR